MTNANKTKTTPQGTYQPSATDVLRGWGGTFSRGNVVRFPLDLIDYVKEIDKPAGDALAEIQRLAEAHDRAKDAATEARQEYAGYNDLRRAELKDAALNGTEPPEDRTQQLISKLNDAELTKVGIARAQHDMAAEVANVLVMAAVKIQRAAWEEAAQRAEIALAAADKAIEAMERTRFPIRVAEWARSPARFGGETVTSTETTLIGVRARLARFLDHGGSL
ncbi:MAG: hypothetical protein WD274_03500 [Acidimicrobiia bacterium]